MDQALLTIDALSKTFPGQVALDDVALRLMPGEVHALVGQNGSGKSTLAKVLAGYHVPDPGVRAQLLGHDVKLPFDDDAARRFHFVHQDLGLVDSLDVLDNFGLVLGYESRLGTIDWRAAATHVREALRPFGLEGIDVSTPVGRLPAWQRAVIAIARGLSGWEIDQGVLVLDETTAALPHTEAAVLFEAIRGVASRKAAVLYITHRLDEVFDVADAVSVLRNGRLIGTHDVRSITKSFLIREMVGTLPTVQVRHRQGSDQVRLRLDDVHAEGIEGVDVSVNGGEIVGVAGLVGSGREVLADVIYGVRPLDAGRVEINGIRMAAPTPRRAQRAGLALVPSDRKSRGLFPSLAMSTNMTLSHHRPLWRHGRLDLGVERADVQRWIDALGIQPSDPDRPVGVLSGGNQQKVMLARALRRQPSVLVLDEPTQGVDIGAKRAIYNLIEQIAAKGTAVLLCTAEPEDLPELCDRVVVMRHRRVGAVLAGDELNMQSILEEACR